MSKKKLKSRRSKNDQLSWLSRLGRGVLTAIKLVLVSVAGLLLLIAGLWVIFPSLLSIDLSKNFVFFKSSSVSNINSFYFAEYNQSLQSFRIFPFDTTTEAKLVFNQNLVNRPVSEWIVQLQIEQIPTEDLNAVFSWLTSSVVEEVRGYEQPLSSAVLLKSARRNLLDVTGYQPGLSQTEFKRKLELYALFRQVEMSLSQDPDQPETNNLDEGECSVAVINTTEISGLAGHFSQILESAGIRIIRLDTRGDTRQGTREEELQPQSSKLAVAPDLERCQRSQDLIRSALIGRADLCSAELSQRLRDRYRADLVILLGNDQDVQTWVNEETWVKEKAKAE